ncbi:hypothetical protein TNIN_123041 [Trichonephila inaurata madagascariensis]|uniref:Uncharacterized protein n=1 Tax=Trichonephila inaurata madagascariensis TaxID=2747483 RepID=A0A8X6YTH9_9ARAC|nr:hypothetical protein TNIN_123041 [Trichonephila inaurata madagascariensis]
MTSEQDSPHMLTHAECDSDDPSTSMETDLTHPTDDDTAICSRILDIEEFRLLQIARVIHHQEVVDMIDNGTIRKDQEGYDSLIKEIDMMMEQLKEQTCELTLLGTCPIKKCQFLAKPKPKTSKPITKFDQKVEARLAKLSETTAYADNIKSNKTRDKGKLNKTKINVDSEDLDKTKVNSEISKAKKNNRPDGFKSPKKVVKRQKVLQNYSIGAAAPINTNNKFQPLDGKDATLTKDDAAMPVAPAKIQPIFLKYQSNYTQIMKEINDNFPQSNSKLS